MIKIEEIDGGLRVVDAAKNEVEIEIDGWEPGGEEMEIDRKLDEIYPGAGDEIRLSGVGVTIESTHFGCVRPLKFDEQIHLPPGEHLCRINAGITIFVRINSPVSLKSTKSTRNVVLAFRETTRFTFGFSAYETVPGGRIRVPPTPEGMSTALTVSSSLHDIETPDRSYPANRPCPPRIKFDEDVGNALKGGGTNQSRPVLWVPSSLDFLFPLAPLAFYIGAKVKVENRENPLLELGSFTHKLPSDTQFPYEIAALLNRVFYLECLVREAGPNSLGIREYQLLEDTSLVPERTYEKTMEERVRDYLDFPFETIASNLPDWPLSTYVEPVINNIPTIPYLLDRMSTIYPPKSSPLDRRKLIERSLSGFYRSTTREPPVITNRSIEILAPKSSHASVQGWIASGSPIDAFKCLPEAFENEQDYLVSSFEPISIKVILNDNEMNVEHSKVIQIYQDRAEELSVELDVLEGISSEDLYGIFESPCDFVHYIGHCDSSGFRCIDGNLSAEQLPQSKVRTFFLNACGSYPEGLELIRKGSVAGAVTFGDVVDAQAAKVGIDFARLYMYGYTIERSLFHARGQAIMNRQYAIVGDGTHVLTQGDSIQPAICHVTRRPDGKYSVQLEAAPVNLNGGVLLAYTNSVPNLMGNHKETQVNQGELEELLRSTNDPIIYEDSFYWPEELLEELF